MKRSNAIFFLFLSTLWIEPAMAYIDPGSGSAIMSAIKTYWYKIKSIFTGKRAPTVDDSQP